MMRPIAGKFVSLCGTTMDALRGPGEPALGCLLVCESDAVPVGGHMTYSGRGFGLSRSETVAAAFGEAFERFSLQDLDDGRTCSASVVDLRRRQVAHISPAELLSLDPADDAARQGAMEPIPPEDQVMLWTSGTNLWSGERILLPARYCLMSNDTGDGPFAGEQHWYCATSNGAAAAATAEQARLSGIMELLERDAFMLMWYHRIRFPHIPVAPASPLGRRIALALAGSTLDLRLLDLSEVHGIPVVIGVARGAGGPGRDVQYGVGGGAGLTLAHAAWRAAKEAIAFYAWQRKQIARGNARSLRAEEVRRFVDRPMYYLDHEHQRELGFLVDDGPGRREPIGDPLATPASVPDALAAVVRHLYGRGIELYAVDLTPSGASAMNLHAVKVVSPDLVPLDSDHQARHLSQDRLRLEPTRRAWRVDVPDIQDLNHVPHPFP